MLFRSERHDSDEITVYDTDWISLGKLDNTCVGASGMYSLGAIYRGTRHIELQLECVVAEHTVLCCFLLLFFSEMALH